MPHRTKPDPATAHANAKERRRRRIARKRADRRTRRPR